MRRVYARGFVHCLPARRFFPALHHADIHAVHLSAGHGNSLCVGHRRRRWGNRRLWRGVMIGAAVGLVAALSCDLFRLPFVYARAWGIESVVPPLNLFKVFPRFGAMILAQPVEQSSYPWAAYLIGHTISAMCLRLGSCTWPRSVTALTGIGLGRW